MRNIFSFLKALVLYFLIIIGIGFIYYKFINLNYYFLNRMVEFLLLSIMYYIINRYFLKMEIKFAFIISPGLTTKRADFQSGQSLAIRIHSWRNAGVGRGLGIL